MDSLISNGIIREYKDNSIISYILENEQLFYEVGYKVLRSQETNGFVKCVKVLHNGKVKLIYDISRFKPLQSILGQMTPESFLSGMSKLLMTVIDVKNNGFMQNENLITDFDRIFIDVESMSVQLIYVPVNTQTDTNSILAFDKKVKSSIIDVISANPHLSSSAVASFENSLRSGSLSLESILEQLKAGISKDNANKQLQPPAYQCRRPAAYHASAGRTRPCGAAGFEKCTAGGAK